jgi:pimeloyl-ACP methyl ester carboxylesterase
MHRPTASPPFSGRREFLRIEQPCHDPVARHGGRARVGRPMMAKGFPPPPAGGDLRKRESDRSSVRTLDQLRSPRRARGKRGWMRHVEIHGLSVAYERRGDGPTLVLLHGFACDSRVWGPQLEGLAKDFTVIAWDAPGAGRSSDPPEAFETGDWADCLMGLLDSLDVPQAHVIGLSWGGIVAHEFCRRFPSRTGSLVLADTYAGWRGSLPGPVAEERLATCLRYAGLPASELVSAFLPGMFGTLATDEVREELAGIMSEFHPAGFRLMSLSSASDRRALLEGIQIPTLLIWGGGDARSPVSVAYQFRDSIPDAKLVVIPGAGHVSNLEAPARFDEAIRDFFRSRSIP